MLMYRPEKYIILLVTYIFLQIELTDIVVIEFHAIDNGIDVQLAIDSMMQTNERCVINGLFMLF